VNVGVSRSDVVLLWPYHGLFLNNGKYGTWFEIEAVEIQ
jgi:hypothetical protein